MLFGKSDSKEYQIVDIHSHILPAVDDGSTDLDNTIKMAKQAALNGVSKIIATPHFKVYKKSADPEAIKHQVKSINLILKDKGIDITLYPGNEIMRFERAGEYLSNSKIQSMNNTKYVLLEFKPFDQFPFIKDEISYLISSGYDVILAHVERYDSIVTNFENLRILKDMHVLIQINFESVVSKVKEQKKFVKKALNERLVDFVASDAHDLENRSYEINKAVKYLYKKYDSDYVDQILKDNANEVLNVGNRNE